MPRAAWDTTPTDYQAGLLIAALADSQHRIPSDARGRTLDIMRTGREWIRARRLTSTTAAVKSGAKDYVLTHHGVNVANRARTAQLAQKYPVGSPAFFTPEGATERDVVVVNSGPDKNGTVEVLSAKQRGKALRAPLTALEELPKLPPEPAGEITDWWTITDSEGVELTRVEAEDDPRARKAAMRHAAVVAAARRDKGFAIRRLRTSELSVPVGELRGVPRISPAPAVEEPARPIPAAAPARRTTTARTEYVGRSIPTRLRADGAPGDTAMSSTGLLVWRLPDGEELTPGEAAKRFLGD
ncbi:hypothetical protein [Streptomyces sp. NPDC001933]|uniref:hypothetical protein n=1 Tax=Streptomyces sp. NPDC001933 TaxID=3364626 RepID=UPI003692F437